MTSTSEAAKFTLNQIDAAMTRTGLSPDTITEVATQLTSSLSHDTVAVQRNKVSRGAIVLYYVGGFVVIGAMSVFLGTGWAEMGNGVGLMILSAYPAFFAAVTAILERRALPVPTGLMATVMVSLVPGVVFALWKVLGLGEGDAYLDYPDFYAYVSSQWLWMELTTLLAGFAVLRWINFSTVLIPVGVAIYFAGMDGAELFFRNDPSDSQRAAVAVFFGIVSVALAVMYDIRGKRRHAFWPHLFGLASLVGGMEWACFEHSAVAASVSLAIGAIFITVGTLMARKVYLAFGAALLFGSASWFVTDVLGGSLIAAPVVALLGLFIMASGVLLQRRSTAIRQQASATLPQWAQRLMNTNDGDPMFESASQR